PRRTCATDLRRICAGAARTHASSGPCCAPRNRAGRPDMQAAHLTRRQFGKAAGALVIGFAFAPERAVAQAASLPGSLQGNRRLDSWLRIDADGSATIFTGKVELGQGILTALAQIAAEELDLPLE